MNGNQMNKAQKNLYESTFISFTLHHSNNWSLLELIICTFGTTSRIYTTQNTN